MSDKKTKQKKSGRRVAIWIILIVEILVLAAAGLCRQEKASAEREEITATYAQTQDLSKAVLLTASAPTMPVVEESENVKVVAFDESLVVAINGRKGIGAVLKPGYKTKEQVSED